MSSLYSPNSANLYNNYHYRNTSSQPKDSSSYKVIGTSFDPYQPKAKQEVNKLIERKTPYENKNLYRKSSTDALINSSYNIINNNINSNPINNKYPFGKSGNYNYYNKNNFYNSRRDQVGELLNYANRENLMDYSNTSDQNLNNNNFSNNNDNYNNLQNSSTNDSYNYLNNYNTSSARLSPYSNNNLNGNTNKNGATTSNNSNSATNSIPKPNQNDLYSPLNSANYRENSKVNGNYFSDIKDNPMNMTLSSLNNKDNISGTSGIGSNFGSINNSNKASLYSQPSFKSATQNYSKSNEMSNLMNNSNLTNIINNNIINNNNPYGTSRNTPNNSLGIQNNNANNNLLSQSPIKLTERISDSNGSDYYIQNCVAIKEYAYKEDPNIRFRSYMEDKGKAVDCFNNDPNCALFCLFDGHGGGEVSKYLQENMPNNFKELMNNYHNMNGNISENSNNLNSYYRNTLQPKSGLQTPSLVGSNQSFVLPENFFMTLFKNVDNKIKNLNYPQVGATGCVCYINIENGQRVLYSANIGDTRSLLISKSGVQRLSYDHRASDKNEQDRILRSGGVVFAGRVYGQLMLSRAFGDWELKQYGVLNDPYVTKKVLTDNDLYLVIGTDGVYDVMEDYDVFTMSYGKTNAKDFCDEIMKTAMQRGTMDNTSCFVVKLN